MKKDKAAENYLERIPVQNSKIVWKADEKGIIILEIENTGWANRLVQKLFGRPRISYIHLDALGSFIWPLIDAEKDITEIGELVDAEFGEKAYPLYERLVQYFKILDSYHFISWMQKK